jgi:hypothetical protein
VVIADIGEEAKGVIVYGWTGGECGKLRNDL